MDSIRKNCHNSDTVNYDDTSTSELDTEKNNYTNVKIEQMT